MSTYHAPTTSITAQASSTAASDVSSLTSSMNALDLSAQTVANSLHAAFTKASTSAASFDQILAGVAAKLASLAISSVSKAASSGLSHLISGAMSGSIGNVAAFADGGIVSSPTFFGSGGGLGVMGERGAEAIMPLARGPDGTLGLATGRQPGAANVVVNISTPDAESFRRSDQQLSASLARAVSRGQRSL